MDFLYVLIDSIFQILKFNLEWLRKYPICSKKNIVLWLPKSNFFNLDQDYRKNLLILMYKINIISFIVKSIFVIYKFDVINIDTFLYIFGES
jgi:hypothetical protein